MKMLTIPALGAEDLIRFFAMVDRSGDCWLWTRSRDPGGYGRFCLRSRKYGAHRVAYQFFRGAPPKGLVLDHLCRNRACVNPDHLEPVTHGENTRRGRTGKHFSERTACSHGHPYTEDNTRWSEKNGVAYRICRACVRHANAAHRARRAR